VASEGRLEDISRFRQSRGLDLGLVAEDARLLLQWRGVEEARSSRLRCSRSLTYRRRDGEGPPEHKSHAASRMLDITFDGDGGVAEELECC